MVVRGASSYNIISIPLVIIIIIKFAELCLDFGQQEGGRALATLTLDQLLNHDKLYYIILYNLSLSCVELSPKYANNDVPKFYLKLNLIALLSNIRVRTITAALSAGLRYEF